MSFLVNSYALGWTPAELGSALALWLDAADTSTIILNNLTVAQWRDKSGNGRHVAQATGSNQPIYTLNGLNGLPVLDWGTAVNSRALSRTGMTGYSPVRYFGVADYDGPNPFSNFFGLISHNYSAPPDLIITNISGSGWWQSLSLNGGASSSVALPTINSPFVFATDSSPSQDRSELFIGRDRDFPDRGWIGKISEIIALNTLPPTADRQRLEGYLAHKWGLVANLPSNHPYKTVAP